MADSVYKVIELVGTSPTSWERAAAAAVKTAAKTLRDLRVAEISQLDVHLEDGKIIAYRARVKVSFKYVSEGTGRDLIQSASEPEDDDEPDSQPAPRRAKAPAGRAKAGGRRKKGRKKA